MPQNSTRSAFQICTGEKPFVQFPISNWEEGRNRTFFFFSSCRAFRSFLHISRLVFSDRSFSFLSFSSLPSYFFIFCFLVFWYSFYCFSFLDAPNALLLLLTKELFLFCCRLVPPLVLTQLLTDLTLAHSLARLLCFVFRCCRSF